MKKVFALLLSVLMVAALMPSAVFAGEDRPERSKTFLYRHTTVNEEESITEVYTDKDGKELLKAGSSMYGDREFRNATTFDYNEKGKLVLQETADSEGGYGYLKAEYDEDGNLVNEEVMESGGVSWTQFFYDKDNNCIKEIFTEKDGLSHTIEYMYDKKSTGYPVIEKYHDSTGYEYTKKNSYNKLGKIENIVFESNDPDEGTRAESYEYTDRGNRKKTETVTEIKDSSGKTLSKSAETETWEYEIIDGEEKCTDHKRMRSEGEEAAELTAEDVTEYDENGNPTKITFKNAEGMQRVTENEYDSDGNLVKSSVSDNLGNWNITENTYENSRMTKTVYKAYDKESDTTNEKNTEYEYDENGNMIESRSDDGITEMYEYLEEMPEEDPSFMIDILKGEYYSEAADWAVEKGITKGMTRMLFKPLETCTRGQAVTFLWRMFGCPEPEKSAKNPFSDVKTDDYFYKAVLWAVDKKITSGETETTFGPGHTCLREHGITFLWRAFEKPVSESEINFSDVQKTDYFYDAVRWGVEKKIVSGVDDKRFAPKNKCQRGHIVTFMYRARDLV